MQWTNGNLTYKFSYEHNRNPYTLNVEVTYSLSYLLASSVFLFMLPLLPHML